MGTHPIFESDFDCLTDLIRTRKRPKVPRPAVRAMIRLISSPESPVDELTIFRRSVTLDEADSTGLPRPETNCSRNRSSKAPEGCQPTIPQRIPRGTDRQESLEVKSFCSSRVNFSVQNKPLRN